MTEPTSPSGLDIVGRTSVVAEPAGRHDALDPCDWSRHIPAPIRSQLTREDHDATLSEYLTHCTSWHMQLMPDLFWQQMRLALASFPTGTDTLYYSPALHCAILADAGATAAPTSVLSQPAVRESLARAARDLAEGECALNVNVIPAIRALCIVARYYFAFALGVPASAGAFGTAVRAALRSGLNLDPGPHVSQEERRARIWCMASLFNQDVTMSMHLGQELSMPAEHVTEIAERTMATFKDDPTLAAFAYTTKYASIAARIASMYSRNGNLPQRDVTAIQVELANIRRGMPAALVLSRANSDRVSFSVLMLDMVYNWLLILLHRPFYSGPSGSQDSQKSIHDASKKIFQSLDIYERLYSFDHAPFTLVQIISAAGAAQVMRTSTLSANAAKPRAEIKQLVEKARDALHQIARLWPCADEFSYALGGRVESDAVVTDGEPETDPSPPNTAPQPIPLPGTHVFLGGTFSNLDGNSPMDDFSLIPPSPRFGATESAFPAWDFPGYDDWSLG